MHENLLLSRPTLALARFTGASANVGVRAPADLYASSFHSFSVLRSGVLIDDPITGVHHPASHTEDAIIAGTTDRRDFTGDWYNAGDYGKWPIMAAITPAQLGTGSAEIVGREFTEIGELGVAHD